MQRTIPSILNLTQALSLSPGKLRYVQLSNPRPHIPFLTLSLPVRYDAYGIFFLIFFYVLNIRGLLCIRSDDRNSLLP